MEQSLCAKVKKNSERPMTIAEFISLLKTSLGFTPTPEQAEAFQVFTQFLCERSSSAVMLLCGSAGTGKTSVASAFVKALSARRQKVVLLAPTGRAAKVFAKNCGHMAHTIHRKIYRQRSLNGSFDLNDNLHTDTIFFVDESSMIANQGVGEQAFGSGYLLDDLVKYVYSGRNCRMVLIGDTAQLPPVGEDASPALRSDIMEGYGLTVYQATLNEVVRQAEYSGILWNATEIRRFLEYDDLSVLPQIRFWGFPDVVRVPGNELIESIANSYREVGIDDTIVITRSNKRAALYNRGIRQAILENEEVLSNGDRIMVVKNNYYWLEQEKNGQQGTDNELPSTFTFIANGDRAIVRSMRNERALYGFNFADVWLEFPDYDNYELYTTVIINSLFGEEASLSRQQQDTFLENLLEDYQHLTTKRDRFKALREDPYYNAIQSKFSYAVTCHKAQGGQWAHVYIDQGVMPEEGITQSYIHWLYTALTRATERVFLVNWPVNQIAFGKGETEDDYLD